MTCPACHSFELDGTGLCGINGGCGYQLRVADERRLRGQVLAPRKDIEDARFDYAVREA